jgi:hypothetical protein
MTDVGGHGYLIRLLNESLAQMLDFPAGGQAQALACIGSRREPMVTAPAKSPVRP